MSKETEQRAQEVEKRKRQRIETAITGVVSGLSPMMRLFLIEYLLHSNATKAAEKAGYAHPNTAGPRLLKNPKIIAAIDEYFHQQEMPARKVVALLSEQAGFDVVPYLRLVKDKDGRVTDAWVDIEAIEKDGLGHLIKGIRYARDGRMIVETYDTHQAKTDIARIHGLFKEKAINLDIDVTGMTDEELDELLDRL